MFALLLCLPPWGEGGPAGPDEGWACIDPRGVEDAAPLQTQTSEPFSRLSSWIVSMAARTIFTASPGR